MAGCTVAQIVTIDGVRFRLRAGETVHTESSYKYPIEGFQRLCSEAGFEARTH